MVVGSSVTQAAAVITGVGSGIGRALAERLAGHGRHVVGVSRDLGSWAANAALPAGFDVVAANLSTSEGIARALEQIHDVADNRASGLTSWSIARARSTRGCKPTFVHPIPVGNTNTHAARTRTHETICLASPRECSTTAIEVPDIEAPSKITYRLITGTPLGGLFTGPVKSAAPSMIMSIRYQPSSSGTHVPPRSTYCSRGGSSPM
jgi:short chain dehydrogenase